MSNDLKCFPINFYLLTVFDALCDGLEGHFLGIWRGVELHEDEVTFFITFTSVFLFLSRFYVFNVFLIFI